MGYCYQLVPISAKFVREVEDLAPGALDAYILDNYPEAEERCPFLWRLHKLPQVFLGGEAPEEAFLFGKPLFNRPETQKSFEPLSPYVVNRRSVGVLIDWWSLWLKEEEVERQSKIMSRRSKKDVGWMRERLRLLRILERRCSLYILYVT